MAIITFKGNTVHTAQDLPAIGSQVSDFKVVKADLSEISLSDFAGKQVVLNIFPSIDTGICAMSVRKFNEMAAGKANTVVLCISQDLPFALKRFCGAEGIENIVTASDFRYGSFDAAYGVKMMDGPLAGLLSRAVVVLDEAGKVIYTEQVPEIAQEPNYEAALAVLG
jgi:thioredoxin-dependent peroxiredoxin